MSGVNKVILIGRLGQDPETKTVTGGQSVCQFSIATSENWMGKDGQKQERTEWHRIVVWGKLADICQRYLSKGREAFVEGRLQTRSWEDTATGTKKYATEIIATNVQFLGGSGAQTSRSVDNMSGGSDSPMDMGGFDPADELPF